jgi:hypothetical protein
VKKFIPIAFQLDQAKAELEAFRQLLAEKVRLSESKDLLPFFRKNKQLTALLGAYNLNIATPDRIAYEYPLYGDLRADVIVGNSQRTSYCFVEFEDASNSSIFQASGRDLPEWSKRFEHGFGQIVDWFWKLGDFINTNDFRNRFGTGEPDFLGVLVIGRDSYLDGRGRQRLEWRRRHLVVDSQHIYCCTYDEFYRGIRDRVRLFEPGQP